MKIPNVFLYQCILSRYEENRLPFHPKIYTNIVITVIIANTYQIFNFLLQITLSR